MKTFTGFLLKSGLPLFAIFASVLVQAESLLLHDQSSIRFISVKNAAVAEVHYFGSLSGVISNSGAVQVNIPLVDVETLIPIRNERMREMLFETVRFPSAQLRAQVDMKTIKALANGEYMELDLSLSLDLHGNTRDLMTGVSVARLGDELHVQTLQPLLLQVSDFGLGDGVERLREVAGLQNIATAVPVMAHLVFSR
ncbi:MAG: YceI family protein [Halieaceae bacterium]